jgi:hypothetical protein
VLRQQLQEMAGPGAMIKVDSFEGAALPPKAQIRSIRISRDQVAAENHSAGGTQVEIITQPDGSPRPSSARRVAERAQLAKRCVDLHLYDLPSVLTVASAGVPMVPRLSPACPGASLSGRIVDGLTNSTLAPGSRSYRTPGRLGARDRRP